VKILVLCALIGGCSSRGDAAAPPAPPPPVVVVDAAPLPVVDAPPPVETSHTIAHGDTLDPIAQSRYGSRHYTLVIEAVDHVDPSKLKIGAVLALPSIDDALAPVARKVPDGTAALLRAHAAWTAISPGLWDEHRRTRGYKSPDLARAIADADAAHAAFTKAHAPAKALVALSSALRDVAGGRIDPEGYNLDTVDRRFADSIAALITWSQR
jgi:hypothetical protein